jgi:hypothetical protein
MHLKLSKLANTRKFTIDIKNRKNYKSEKKKRHFSDCIVSSFLGNIIYIFI